MYSRLFALVAGILFSITGYTQTIEERLDALEEAIADADCAVVIKPDWGRGHSRRGTREPARSSS